ncbi:hypothetical protein RHGRI_011925 [Rhododendron griersonianum]|uniref:Uncharacterized protein n=1 Tax=Rhododendron griersonianum TaxID=479676 RepID=A0AAV6KNL9_9ERIC|nr:hypothetical protein RHGRI_011925 [Rhododendron griersonianum]
MMWSSIVNLKENLHKIALHVHHDDEVLEIFNSPDRKGHLYTDRRFHITGSTNVFLENYKIGTGDDCISIVSGSSNIKMKTIYCGPGHGTRYECMI